MNETMLNNLSAEDRACYMALANAIQNQNAIASQALARKEKGWFAKACDAIEAHPVLTVSAVLLVAVAAECYVASRMAKDE